MTNGSISFDPNSPIYNPGLYEGTAKLNLTQSQLDSITQATNASSPFDVSRSLLEYRKTVSTTNLEENDRLKEDRLFESTQFKPVRWDAALTAEYFRGLIQQFSDYMDKREQLNTDIKDAKTTFETSPNPLFPTLTQMQNAANSAQSKYGAAFNQAIIFNSATGADDAALQPFRDSYNNAVDDYNDKATDYNNIVNDYNALVAQFNSNNFDVRAAQLNNLSHQLKLNEPPYNVPDITTVSDLQPLPLLDLMQKSPPLQPGTSTPGTPYFGQTNLAATLPDFPASPTTITYTDDPYNRDQFNNTVVDPLKALIDQLIDVNKQVDEYIRYQNFVQLAFGQLNLEAGVDQTKQVSQDVSTSGTGNSLATATDNKANPQLPAKVSTESLEELYKRFDTYPSAAEKAQIADLADKVLSVIVNSRTVVDSAQSAGSGLVGPTPNTSPTVTVATALTALGNLGNYDALLAGNNLDLTKIVGMISASNAGKSPDEIEALAKGVLAAIKLQVAQIVIVQLEKAIGASGLLAQLLSNLGSIDKDAILQLTQGLVNYKNAFDSPIAAQGLINQTTDALKQAGLSEDKAARIANEAFNNAAQRQAIQTEDQAKQAFLNSVRSALEQNEIDAANQEKYLTRIQDSLDNANNSTLALQEQTNRDLVSFELKREIKNTDLEKEDQARLSDRIDNIKKENLSRDEENASYLNALQQAGVDNAESILNQATNAANNPLRSFTQQSVLSTDQLAQAFNDRIVATLNQPGSRIEESEVTAGKFTDVLVAGPNSILNIVDQGVKDYNKAVKEDQGNQAVELFKDGLTLNWDSLKLSNEVYNTANFLVYSDKLSMQGVHGTTMNPGSPAGTGYLNNDKFV